MGDKFNDLNCYKDCLQPLGDKFNDLNCYKDCLQPLGDKSNDLNCYIKIVYSRRVANSRI